MCIRDRVNNTNDNETLATFANNGAVSLYYDNSKKLETTTTGAKVTGALEVTQEYPSIRPTLDLNFAATKTLDRRITFTRDSLGTYVDELSIIRTVSNNTPRFDHDPTTGESLGLLIEESRTNLCINSTSSSAWGTPFQLTKNASKTITAPSGDIDAYEWTETTDSTTHLNNGPTITISSGSSYSISAFFKKTAGTVDRGYFLQWYKSGGQTVKVSYVPSTDTTYISNSGGASAPTNVSVVTYPNGWYKISFTAALAETSALAIVGLTNASGNTSFTGDTSGKHSFWGLQYEAGSFPTSYIPTSGSTVTRARDYAKITGTNFSDFYNKDEGTLFVNYKLDKSNYLYSPVGVDMVKFEADGNSGGHSIRIVSSVSTPQLDAHGVDDSAVQFDLVGINLSDGLKDYFVAQAFALNDVAVSFNGAAPQTDTSVTVVEWDKLHIGTTPRRAHYKSVKYYNKRLPNAQLQGLTQQ